MPKVILTVEGQTQGWVSNPSEVIAPIQQVEGANLQAASAIEKTGQAAIPSARSMRTLGMAGFALTGSMHELGPAAGEVGTALRIMGLAMNGALGQIGIALAAIGALAFALYELTTATKKAEEASLKQSEGLVKLGDHLKNHADLLRQEIEYRKMLLSHQRDNAEKHLEEIQHRTLLQSLMKGGLNVYGYEIQAIGKVAGAHWAGTWAAAKYHEELDKGLKEIAKYNEELETTTSRVMGVAAAMVKAAAKKTEKDINKPGKAGEDPEAKYNALMFKLQQEHDKKMLSEAQKSTDEFNRIWEEAGRKEYEEQVKLASKLMSSEVSTHNQKLALIEAERKAYLALTGDEVTANKLANAAKKKLNDQEAADKKKLYADLKKGTLNFAMATAKAFGLSSKAQIEASIAIAAVQAIMEMAKGFSLMALGDPKAAAAFMAAAQYGTVAMTGAAQLRGTMAVPTPTTGTGGGGYGGGGGGTVQSAPSGPMTNYYYFSSTVNGNVIGLDSFTKYLDEWFLQKLRMSGGDIVRSGNR